jgi:hypothetical protein
MMYLSQGGPNSGHKALCERIVESRTDVELVCIGDLLRDGVALRQLEDIDWDEVSQQMAAGELVADVREEDCSIFLINSYV